MSGPSPVYRAVAVRYAERATTLGEVYYHWSAYGEPDGPIDMAYYFWLLQRQDDPAAGTIVVDCGFDVALGERRGRTCLCAPSTALRRLGVDPGAVTRVVVTHMHYDHIGNLGLFPRARFSVARRELEFWAADPIAARAHFAQHTDPDGVALLRQARERGRVDLVEDDGEVAPGIRALRVGGHAPGQLVLTVPTASGELVLASDAIHYDDELVRERPFMVFSDLAEVYRAYDTVRALTAGGAVLVPGHDPSVMERFDALDDATAGLAVLLG